MSQFSLWLYPLILSSGLAIIFLIRGGIKWTWGGIIQQLLILSAGGLGFLTGNYALWALVGWSLFFLFNLGSRALANRALSDLTILRTKSAVEKARRARLLIWGPVGLFGQEMAEAVDAIVSGETEKANRLIEKWDHSGLPRRAKESLHGYVMLGRVIQRDYPAIVEEYEKLERDRAAAVAAQPAGKKRGDRMPFDVFTAAARAYLELDMYEQALQALEEHDLASYRSHPLTLDSVFMAYSALLGAEKQLAEISDRLSRGRNALPEYSRVFWSARCYARRGEVERALAAFRQALSLVPVGNDPWRRRIEGFIYLLEDHSASPAIAPPAVPDESLPWGSVPPMPSTYFQSKPPQTMPSDVDGVSHVVVDQETIAAYAPRLQFLLDRARYIHDLIAPSKMGPGTKVLLVSLILVFLIGNLWQFTPGPLTFHIAELSTNGVLSAPDVTMKGEYWRLLSYMFLHANISHLAMNVLGLVWFGKLVERLYGTPRFLLLYFACGLLSGCAHMLSTPDQPAVGASGAIMGIFGAGTAAMLRLRGVIPSNIRRTELIWLFSLAGVQAIFDQIVNLFALSHDEKNTSQLPRVASMAHLGGMVSGFLLGLVIPLKAVDRRFSAARSTDVNRPIGE